MFVAQLGASMALWAGLIVFLYRDRARLYRWAARMTRGQRAFHAAKNLGASILFLALMLFTLPNGGFTPHGLSVVGWLSVTIVGGLFVALQTAGLFPLALNAVTREPAQPSDSKDVSHPS